MQGRRHDVIGLTETRRHRPLNATIDTGEELFLGACDSRGVGGVGVLVNTNLVMNIDSFEQPTTRIGRLRREDVDQYRLLQSSSPTLQHPATMKRRLRPLLYGLGEVLQRRPYTLQAGFWGDAVVDNIEGDDRPVQRLRDNAMSAEGSRATKRRLSYETLELIRQRGAARAAGNYHLTSKLAKQCREAIKEDLKDGRAAVLAEAAEAEKSIRSARRDLANCKTKMSAL
ncbi:hypothetical protein ANCDUO_02724 [Ancylostoma duodenale]|uniref:Uncharacterized protein n=1 Tax=Ancylostoma duodenale TaxID=51022 RepID=A0A0C2DVR0_9BILA|nr:hypothetical protein ANCDUO_02724 [Ancylostoma duodenale]